MRRLAWEGCACKGFPPASVGAIGGI